jgi:hypothetical protein
MAFLEPKKWALWLSLAEWWYNSNYHTSLECTPFESLYGYPQPLISEVMIPGPESPVVNFSATEEAHDNKTQGKFSPSSVEDEKVCRLEETR